MCLSIQVPSSRHYVYLAEIFVTAGKFHKEEKKIHQRQTMLRKEHFDTGECWVL